MVNTMDKRNKKEHMSEPPKLKMLTLQIALNLFLPLILFSQPCWDQEYTNFFIFYHLFFYISL